MSILGILLLVFTVGIILAATFGRKYKDLTDEEKEIYHRIEKEKGKRPETKKTKIWLVRLWLVAVIAGGCFTAVYFDASPVWTVIGMYIVFRIPFTLDLIITVADAIEYNRKRRTPANTPRKLKGFVGGVPIYED
jgi:hypothetical protein